MDPRLILRALFDAAVDAALPHHAVPKFLPEKPRGRTIVIGAGKASAAMARAFEQHWPHDLKGLVVTRYGHAVPCQRIRIVEAAHPIPDAAALKAAEDILALVQGLSREDLVVALISGGGSSLLSLPVAGVSAEEKRAVNKALLMSGAPIQDMNCVRKHLSRIKGGRLAQAAFPARVETLVISDVPSDDISSVASGPTVPDPTTFADAIAVLNKHKIDVPASVLTHLLRAENETPKPGDAKLANTRTHLIASPQSSLEAAAAKARSLGLNTIILGDAIEGEAREVGIVHAGVAKQVSTFRQPIKPPCVILSGGETTVTVKGNGAGGRNVEFLLSLALKLNGLKNVFALAADTDGIDGARDVAGAVITPDTLDRARIIGLNGWDYLARNDAHPFFEKLNDQIITGPTLTNVNDFRAMLILN